MLIPSRATNWTLWQVPVVLLLSLSCASCTVIKGTLALPDKAIQSISSSIGEGEKNDPVELQSQLIRFSDHYLDAMISGSGKLRVDGDEKPERRSLLRRRINIINDVLAIATGSNAYANLLDMILLVTLNRNNAASTMPERYGDSAKMLLAAAQESEKEVWRIAEATLKREQIDELRSNIDAWLGQYGDGRARRDMGVLGLSTEIAKMHKSNQADKTSVFNLLVIDPFAGLDPATSELANTRLFAERGLFLARHMPTLLRLETELLTIQTTEIPQLESLLASINQLSAAAERFSQVSAQLPAVISGERAEIVRALDTQRPGLISLAAQTEKALNAGQFMSEATNTTLKTFQDLVKQLNDRPSDPNAEPFKITEYTAMAHEVSAATQQLVRMLELFGSTLSDEHLNDVTKKVDLLSQRAEASGQNVVDYAFGRLLLLGMMLVTFTCVMILLTSLLYWRLRQRFAGGRD